MVVVWGSATAEFVRPPYLQNLTDSTLMVIWESADSCIGRVRYGFSTAYQFQVSESIPTTIHELQLKPLIPDTVYHYQVISGTDTTTDATFFTTCPPERPFRFLVYGDTRTDSAAHQAVVDQMALTNPPPRILLHVGDLTESGTTPEYQTFFQIEQAILSRSPVYPALGNHELRNLPNWFNYLYLPGNERWFTFHYGNCAFYFLDNYSDYAPGTEQYEWFIAGLQADSADPQIRHIFVLFHEPPYTTNAAHSGNQMVRDYLCPLFERFRVRAVFNGHIHAYEHSLVNGVHYITSGGGGAPLHREWGPEQPWTVYRETNYQFMVIDVADEIVTCRSVRADGSTMELFNLTPGITEETPKAGPKPKLTAIGSPANPAIELRFTLTEETKLKLTIIDPTGRERLLLARGKFCAATHTVTVAKNLLPAGPYFAVLKTPSAVHTARLTIF